MLILSNEQIEEILTMEECITVLEEAYRDLSEGKALISPRVDNLAPNKHKDAYYGFKHMGGSWPRQSIQALRINSDILTHPYIGGTQRRVKVPSAGGRWVGLVELFSMETGELLAIFPDGVVQHMRVGAANGIAAKYLSRPEAGRVGLIGAGWQAETQLMAVKAVRPIEHVKVYSQRQESREAFARRFTAKLGIPVQAVGNAEECAENVDIILAATSSMVPVLKAEWLKPGIHVSCIKTQEIGFDVIQNSDKTVVHTNKQGKQIDNIMPGTSNIIEEHLKGWWNDGTLDWSDFPDLAQLTAGHTPGRISPDEITCFINNVGLGLQFAAVGSLVLKKAEQLSVGKEIPSEWFTEDVHP